MSFTVTRNQSQKVLLRGDSAGQISLWFCPDIGDLDIQKLEVQKAENIPGFYHCFILFFTYILMLMY